MKSPNPSEASAAIFIPGNPDRWGPPEPSNTRGHGCTPTKIFFAKKRIYDLATEHCPHSLLSVPTPHSTENMFDYSKKLQQVNDFNIEIITP